MSTINSIPFRSTIFYRTDGTVAPLGTVFTIGTNNTMSTTNSLSLDTLTASTMTSFSTITASTIRTAGANVAIGQNVSNPNRFVDIRSDIANSMYFDFHSSDSAVPDYSTRIQSLGGATTGTGALNMTASTIGLMASSGVGIGTTNPQATLHVQGGTLVTNPTIYNTAVGGWFIIGYWDCSAAQNSGAHLKLRIMGCNGYDNTGGTANQMGGETTIYLNNLNNLNTTTNANVDGLWKHEGGQIPFTSVKAVQGGSRYQYYIYASVHSYTQHSITAETTQGTIWTSQFTSTTDPGANSLTVRALTFSTAAVGTNVGIGTTAPSGTLHVHGAGTSASYTSYQVSIGNSSSVRNLLIGVDGVSASLQSVVNLTTTPSPAWLTLNPSGGNVGIGTNSPGATLDVAGTARAGRFETATVTTASIANGAAIDVSQTNFGTSITGMCLISVQTTTSGQFYATYIVNMWNPTITAVSLLIANGIACSSVANNLRITNNTGSTFAFKATVVCIASL